MRKSILKALVSTAIVGAVMSISSVVSFAATTTWVFETDGSTFPAAIGEVQCTDATATITGDTGRKATFKEAIFADGTNALAGKKGIDFSKQTGDFNRLFKFTPSAAGQYEFFIARTGGSEGTFRLYSYDEAGTSTQIGDDLKGYGRDTTDIEPVTLEVEAGKTYGIYANNSGCGLFAVRFTDSGSMEYFPEASAETVAGEVWLGGTPTTCVDKGAAISSSGAEVVGGKVSSNKKVRFGKDALASGADITSANMGYITFPGTNGDFNVIVNCASSGTAARPFAIGTFADGVFTKIADLETPASQTPEDVTYSVKNGSASTTYAIYLEPKADGAVADNTDFYTVSLIGEGAVQVTVPGVQLNAPTLTDGKIVVVADINAFSKDYYQVNKVTLKAASAKTSQDSAVWTNLNITKVKANSDGTFTFTAKLKNTQKNAHYQAELEYVAVDDLAEGGKAVSNMVRYTAAE